MKNYIIIGLLLSSWMVACTPDNGNYNYVKLNEVAIDSIHEEYVVNRFSNLKIKPELTFSLGEDENFSYLWYLFQNTSEKIDTLSFDRNLDVKINVLPGVYALMYKVFDTEKDVYYYNRTDIVVKDVLSEGVLVLGSVNDSLNISMVNTEGVVSRDIYKGFTGNYLGKNPESIWHFIPANSGNYLGREYITVVYDGGKAALFDPLNFVKVMDGEQLFAIQPEKVKIEGYHPGYGFNDYLINNGKLHHRWYYMEYNIAVEGDYYLSTVPVGKYNRASGDMICFYDMKGKRFVTMDDGSGSIMKEMEIHKSPQPPFNPKNVGLDIIYVFNLDGWCNGFFRDPSTSELYQLDFQLRIVSGITKMTPQKIRKISAEKGVSSAERMIMFESDSRHLIYAKGSALWIYGLDDDEEYLLLDFNTTDSDYEIVKLIQHEDHLIVALNDLNKLHDGGDVRVLETGLSGGVITLTEKARYSALSDRIVDIAYKFMNK